MAGADLNRAHTLTVPRAVPDSRFARLLLDLPDDLGVIDYVLGDAGASASPTSPSTR